jgi:hypothetical protein
MSKVIDGRLPCPNCPSSDAKERHQISNRKYFQKNKELIQERRLYYYRMYPMA